MVHAVPGSSRFVIPTVLCNRPSHSLPNGSSFSHPSPVVSQIHQISCRFHTIPPISYQHIQPVIRNLGSLRQRPSSISSPRALESIGSPVVSPSNDFGSLPNTYRVPALEIQLLYMYWLCVRFPLFLFLFPFSFFFPLFPSPHLILHRKTQTLVTVA